MRNIWVIFRTSKIPKSLEKNGNKKKFYKDFKHSKEMKDYEFHEE